VKEYQNFQNHDMRGWRKAGVPQVQAAKATALGFKISKASKEFNML